MRSHASLLVLSLCGLLALPLAAADQPTYYGDVKAIFQENCETCHRPAGQNQGGVFAPMSLQTYDEVRPWARSIARAVESRDMPPWFATEHTRGQFHGERVLSEQQVATVIDWVKGGAQAGDPADSPPQRSFIEEQTDGWTSGTPDLVVPLPEPYFIADDIDDLNIRFTTTLTREQLPEDTWLQGIEFRVGSPNVHHMCASAYSPGTTPSSSDAGKSSRNALGCIALGAEPTFLPESFAQLLEAGSTIAFSMHYNKEPGQGSGFWDQSEMALYFAEEQPKHKVVYDAIGNRGFEIPPHHPRWHVGAAKTFDEDSYLLAMWPHAHLRAVATQYELFLPDGTRELLLDVPEYDQEWQTTYIYKELKLLPAGSRLEVSMWYDNTEERAKERGFDPNRAIDYGAETTDEMMLGFINWAPAAEYEAKAPALGTTATGGSD